MSAVIPTLCGYPDSPDPTDLGRGPGGSGQEKDAGGYLPAFSTTLGCVQGLLTHSLLPESEKGLPSIELTNQPLLELMEVSTPTQALLTHIVAVSGWKLFT